MPPAFEIHGPCDPRFPPLEAVFRAHFEEDLNLGASLALTLRGVPAVDLWDGYGDRRAAKPWERDTRVPVFSTTKIMIPLALLTHQASHLDGHMSASVSRPHRPQRLMPQGCVVVDAPVKSLLVPPGRRTNPIRHNWHRRYRLAGPKVTL